MVIALIFHAFLYGLRLSISPPVWLALCGGGGSRGWRITSATKGRSSLGSSLRSLRLIFSPANGGLSGQVCLGRDSHVWNQILYKALNSQLLPISRWLESGDHCLPRRQQQSAIHENNGTQFLLVDVKFYSQVLQPQAALESSNHWLGTSSICLAIIYIQNSS